jgi:hypothetical protein
MGNDDQGQCHGLSPKTSLCSDQDRISVQLHAKRRDVSAVNMENGELTRQLPCKLYEVAWSCTDIMPKLSESRAAANK